VAEARGSNASMSVVGSSTATEDKSKIRTLHSLDPKPFELLHNCTDV